MTADPPPIRVLGGSPTDEETAAVAALFTRLLIERAAVAQPLPQAPRRSDWERSIRTLRAPLRTERAWFGS